ncbi:MAG: hypothetical protein V2J51_13425 [Erythrobacter sp.]|nr:hypothetical protein [Erythrobacter sp.]
MRRIAFLACKTTLPASEQRRADAYEHDLTMAALRPAFEIAGLDLQAVDWEAPLEAFASFDAALLGTAWNYQERPDAFLARIDALAARGIAMFNPPEIAHWNIAKTYLSVLDEAGAPTVPTLWHSCADAADALAAMDHFGCDRLVVKKQIGAGAEGQILLEREAVLDRWRFDGPAMLQPFLPAIADEGELSFVFIDGRLSHAVRKVPASGDYRIQSLYGGREEPYQPAPADLAAAARVISALPFPTPLYARIDMVRGQRGLLLMEAELIEPYLYPEQGPGLGHRLAAALAERIVRA